MAGEKTIPAFSRVFFSDIRTKEYGTAIAVDSNNNAYITGFTKSALNFPIVNNLQAAYGGSIDGDAFVSKIAEGIPCSVTPLGVGQTISGTLASSDCTVNNRYADTFTFSGTAGQQVAATLTSSAFDSYLVLLDSREQSISEDNDGGGGTNARLPAAGFFTLPAAGTYTLRVTSFDPIGGAAPVAGNYSISLSEKPANCNYSLSASSINVPATGGANQSFTVNTTAGCGWTAAKNAADSRVTFNGNAGGTGTGPSRSTWRQTRRAQERKRSRSADRLLSSIRRHPTAVSIRFRRRSRTSDQTAD